LVYDFGVLDAAASHPVASFVPHLFVISKPMITHRLLTGLLLAVSLVTSACGMQEKSAMEEARVLRIILVPATQGSLDPTSGMGLEQLSRVAGVPLVYLRSMSDGGHVLATAERVSPSAAAEILQRLAADPAIAQVEEDRRASHQSPRVTP